jgi:hypothetical protein
LNESHLRSILTDYISYYNKYRTHLGIDKDSPEGRPIQAEGTIYKVPAVNGLTIIIIGRLLNFFIDGKNKA